MTAGKVAYVPDRGDVVWLVFDPQAEREQAGRRSALTLSGQSYNAKTGLAVFCPITSHAKGYPFECAMPEGAKIAGVVLADHVKNLDWRARQASFVECAAPGVLRAVDARLRALLSF